MSRQVQESLVKAKVLLDGMTLIENHPMKGTAWFKEFPEFKGLEDGQAVIFSSTTLDNQLFGRILFGHKYLNLAFAVSQKEPGWTWPNLQKKSMSFG